MDSVHKLEFLSDAELEEAKVHGSYRLLILAAVLVVAIIALALLGHLVAAVAVFVTAGSIFGAGHWFAGIVIVQVLQSQRERKGRGWGRSNG